MYEYPYLQAQSTIYYRLQVLYFHSVTYFNNQKKQLQPGFAFIINCWFANYELRFCYGNCEAPVQAA